jgi:hypothetical protein
MLSRSTTMGYSAMGSLSMGLIFQWDEAVWDDTTCKGQEKVHVMHVL